MNRQEWLRRQIAKITIWVVFVVGISLLPFVVLYFNSTIGGTKFTQERLYGGGELLLVVAVIAADTIGRLLQVFYRSFLQERRKDERPGKDAVRFSQGHFLLLIFCGIFALAAILQYTAIVTRLEAHLAVDVGHVIVISQRFLLFALLMGAGVIIILEE